MKRSLQSCPELALAFGFILLLAVPAEEALSDVTLRAKQLQTLADELRSGLSVGQEVQIAVVIYHPLVFAVEPVTPRKQQFRLSVELGFLQMLKEDELRAALAHELGHVWIFTHHPFLQTERLANEFGQRLVSRDSLERLYMKLWAYEGTSGAPIDQLLGPRPSVAAPRE